jgi:hypothetical protein
MKKQFIILLIILSACSTLKKPSAISNSQQPLNKPDTTSNSHEISNKADITVSTNQSSSYEPLEKFKGDTLGYVQHNFIDNKQKYIGKDLNTLLKDVEIPVKSYIPSGSTNQPTIMPAMHLEFYTSNQVTERLNSPDKLVDIIIIWSPPLPYEGVEKMWLNNKGAWTDAERNYYGKQIIGDILTTKFDK